MPYADPIRKRENHTRYMRDVYYPKKAQSVEIRARMIVRNEVKQGRLAPVTQVVCECGETEGVQRHHPDHTKPLVFHELCVECHRKADAGE
jgi:hypothetical protein